MLEAKCKSESTTQGFTLIELLIVVAIIAILAGIALPNFLQAQVRAKVSRVKSDIRTLSLAIESYAVDNNEYPPVPIALPARFRRFIPLTTPVSYIVSIPRDPFESTDQSGFGRFRAGLYAYGAAPLSHASRWILSSDGPDRRMTMDRLDLRIYVGSDSLSDFDGDGQPDPIETFYYDSTNGSISVGDIIRASDSSVQ